MTDHLREQVKDAAQIVVGLMPEQPDSLLESDEIEEMYSNLDTERQNGEVLEVLFGDLKTHSTYDPTVGSTVDMGFYGLAVDDEDEPEVNAVILMWDKEGVEDLTINLNDGSVWAYDDKNGSYVDAHDLPSVQRALGAFAAIADSLI